jgi:two-component system chemotaxis response regulator CheY
MSKTIMTVDDATTMRRMIAFALKPTGHAVLEAPDGRAALALARSRQVDLVITDVNMPNMGGLELTKELRAIPSYARVPIILLTTESDPEMKNKGRAAGATGWIVKPFNPEQLVAVVSRVLPN